MPDDDEQLRRLLAEARHTEPMPGDVADRLDRVIDDLRTAAPESTEAPPVVDLAAARRRRNVRSWLVAAAAVAVVAVGINQADFSGLSAGDSADSTSAGGRAERAPDDHLQQREHARAPDPDSRSESYAWRAPVPISSERYGKDVRRAERVRVTAARALQGGVTTSSDPDGSPTGDFWSARSCSTKAWGSGRLVPARYDGRLGGLVFRKAAGQTQVVDLFLCGSDEPSRSITLPAP